MPSNQLSPWEGGDIRDVHTADSPTTKHPKATKVPLRPTFVEVPERMSPARPQLCDPASPVPPSVPVSAPQPVTSLWSYNRNHSPVLPASVPHISNILHRLNGSRRLNQVLAAGTKQGKKPTEAKPALNAPPGGTTQKQRSTTDAQPANLLKVSRLLDESIEPLDWRPFLSVSTLCCREKSSGRQRGKVQVSSRRRFSSSQQLVLSELDVFSSLKQHNNEVHME